LNLERLLAPFRAFGRAVERTFDPVIRLIGAPFILTMLAIACLMMILSLRDGGCFR